MDGFLKNSMRGIRASLRQKAQGLPPRGDRRGEFDAGARGLAFCLGGFGLDAQARRQVGFAKAEGLVEEAARLAGELGAALRSCELGAGGVDADLRSLAFRDQTLAFQAS
jgi:hypothetical protein